MCATTHHPAEASTDGETNASPPTAAPNSSPSSCLTHLSTKQLNDGGTPASAAVEGSVFQQDSTTSSSRARFRSHQRRPSLVQSDDGLGHCDGDECSHDSSENDAVGNFCAQMMLPAVCQGAGDQLDIFMACRHPLDLLGISGALPDDDNDEGTLPLSQQHPHSGGGDDAVAASHQVSGYHAIPTTCEYCGSNDITKCQVECQRPKSFFPKQRPPFCPRGGLEWDTMDFAVTSLGVDKSDVGVESSNRSAVVRRRTRR